MKKKYIIILSLFFLFVFSSWSQEDDSSDEKVTDSPTTTITLNSSYHIDEGSQNEPFFTQFEHFVDEKNDENDIAKATQVLGATDYIVTPGDTYSVSYLQGTAQITRTGIVKNNYKLDFAVLGTIDVSNMTYIELESTVKELVKSSYPSSFPEFMIQEPGNFNVLLRGQVNKIQYKSAWGLTRLSELLIGSLTEYSSIRKIKIINDNEEKIIDLQRFTLLGDVSCDPRIKYGDIIEIPIADKTIELSGEVFHKGKIELLNDETLEDLIMKWGGGFTPKADVSRIVTKNSVFGNKIKAAYFDENSMKDYIPENGDQIHVYQKAELKQMVSFQGALNESKNNTLDASFPQNSEIIVGENTSNFIYYSIKNGEKISTAAGAVSSYFNLTSDLAKTKIIRESGEIINVDLEVILLQGDLSYDPELLSGDIIVIPFKQLSVYMTGAFSGAENGSSLRTVPFIAGQTYDYYVQRVGGFARYKHLGEGVSITNKEGNKVSYKGRIIQPGDVIYASYNHPFHWFGEYQDFITAITTTAAFTLGLYNYYVTIKNAKINETTPIPTP